MPARSGLRILYGHHASLLELEAAILRSLALLERLGIAGADAVELQLVPEAEDGTPMRVMDGRGDPLRDWTPPRPKPAAGATVVQLTRRRSISS